MHLSGFMSESKLIWSVWRASNRKWEICLGAISVAHSFSRCFLRVSKPFHYLSHNCNHHRTGIYILIKSPYFPKFVTQSTDVTIVQRCIINLGKLYVNLGKIYTRLLRWQPLSTAKNYTLPRIKYISYTSKRICATLTPLRLSKSCYIFLRTETKVAICTASSVEATGILTRQVHLSVVWE